MRLGFIVWGSTLVVFVLVIALWSWPKYMAKRNADSGLRAAELGAMLAFAQSTYKAKHGVYAFNLENLQSELDDPLPCPLSEDKSQLLCDDYTYYLDGVQLVAVQKADPLVWFTYDLPRGVIDCSHGPEDVRQSMLCTAND